MTNDNIDFIAAVARPGDTVLIGFSGPLDDADIEALDESFEPIRRLGIEVGYMDNVSSMVVVRPGDAVAKGFNATAALADENIDPRGR